MMEGALVKLMLMVAKGYHPLLLDLDDGSEALDCEGPMRLDSCERRRTLCGLPLMGTLVATTSWGQHRRIKYFLQ
jgi:hypothetical protein